MDDTQFGIEASEDQMGLQCKASYGSVTGNQIKPHPKEHTVTDIVSGLCESIRNMYNHRLLLHEEIKDMLKRQVLTKEDGK